MSAARTQEAPELPLLEYELFRRLIRDAFGLDYPPHKRDLLRTRLDRRLRANGLRRYSDYYRVLCYASRAADEWRVFAETITNNETYFFRERRQFFELAELLPSIASERTAPVRVLSAGCSSGEEAYGLAMLLSTHLGRSARFEVHGVDVSEAKLAFAREGRYSERSFHAEEQAPPGVDLDQYMSRDAQGAYVVRNALRTRVAFARCNLIEQEAVARLGEFDVVFCRNVLIYADDESLQRFFASLAALVRPNGYLFLGHSDSFLGAKPPFRLLRVGERFAYVRSA